MMFRTIGRRLAVFLLMISVAVIGVAAAEQQAAAATRHPLKVSTANIGSVKDPNLGPMLKNRKPQVMVVTEAYYAHAKLSSLAKKYGYRVKQYSRKQGAEGPDVALLIRNGVTIESVSLMKMSKTWKYTNKNHVTHVRRPRRYPVAVIKYSGKTWTVIGVHFPTGGPGGRNKAAWNESKKRIQSYAANHKSTPVVVAGDYNPVGASMSKQFPGFLIQGDAPDLAMIKKGRGARFEGKPVRSPVRNNNSHGWLTYHLSAA